MAAWTLTSVPFARPPLDERVAAVDDEADGQDDDGE